MKCEEIVRRLESLKAGRSNVESLWDTIERFVIPLRGDFYRKEGSESEVDWRTRDVYDSTAPFACQSLAARMQGDLTSPSERWFDMRFRKDELNSKDEAKEWLEESSERMWQALLESNFNIEVAESYLDLTSFGNTVLVEEGNGDGTSWQGLNFSSIPIRECYFEAGHDGAILNFYRHLKWTPLQMIDKFGEEGVPKEVLERADNPDQANSREDVIFCIYKKMNYKAPKTKSRVLAPNARPYGYKYVLMKTKEPLGEEGGYYEQPSFIARWRKNAGSDWGFGPAAGCLGDILTLNQLKEVILEAAGKVIDPSTLAEQGAVFGDFDLSRAALNIVADIDRIRPYESGARFDVSNLVVSELQQTIRSAFYQDQLELKESPAMTATEVNVRYELMQRLLGPTLGRLQNDFLDPLIERTFGIMYRAKALPELPTGLEDAELDIEYTGPLPRAQKAKTAGAIEQWLMATAQMAEIYPEVLDLPDVDEAWRTVAELRGVPAKAVRDEEDIEESRAAKEQQADMMNKMAAMQQGGEAMRSVGEGKQAMGEAGIEPEAISGALAQAPNGL